MSNTVEEYADFLGSLTGHRVSQVIVDRFTVPMKDGYCRPWSYEEIERLHLLDIAAKTHDLRRFYLAKSYDPKNHE